MRIYLFPIFLVLIGFITFYDVLYQGFKLDDVKQIVNNQTAHSVRNIPSFFTRVLTYPHKEKTLTTYYYKPVFHALNALLYAIGGGNAFYFHLFQVGLYIINTVVLFFFFSQVFRPFLAFCLSLLFLVHPTNQEVAGYIANIQDVLYFFFGFSALLIIQSRLSFSLKIVLCCILVFLSMLSKETGVIFVIALPLFTYLFQRKYFKQFGIALLLVFVGYVALRLNASHATLLTLRDAPIQHMSIEKRLIIFPKMFYFYISETLIPNLTVSVSFMQSTDLATSFIPTGIMLLSTLLIGTAALFIRQRSQYFFRIFLFFAILFFVGASFHSHILPLDIIIAKRWAYLPLAGWLGMLGTVIHVFYPILTRKHQAILLSMYIVYIAVLFIMTKIITMYSLSYWRQ